MSEITKIQDPIEAYDRDIKRLEEIKRTLGSGVLNQPNKESTALDLLRFLEGYPQVKKDIERYARYALEQQLKKKRKVILNYIDGCTAYNLTIDGIEASELPPYGIADIIRYLVDRCKDKELLEEILRRLIESDKESVCSIRHCDQSGDDIYNYKLEI